MPGADLHRIELDLGSQKSVERAALAVATFAPIDAVVNNGGATSGPGHRTLTEDGYELVVGTNAWGPFAFTARVFPWLAPDARVVWLGSLSTRLRRPKLDDLEREHGRYDFFRQYATSKHLQHAFALELDRRLRTAGSGIRSVLAHPGFALDSIGEQREGITDQGPRGQKVLDKVLRPVTQGKDRGAWPIVQAVVSDQVEGGEFWGPSKTLKGRPVRLRPNARSASPAFGAAVWAEAERRTGVRFELTPQ